MRNSDPDISYDDKAEILKQKKEFSDHVFGPGHEITLNSGRVIDMKSFHQNLYYSGLLEGLPRFYKAKGEFEIIPWMNKNTLIGETYIVYAPMKKWDFYDNSKHIEKIDYPPTTFPRIECTATFKSQGKIQRDDVEDHDYSLMKIVWFQNDWGFTINPIVMERIKAIDWDRLASPAWV